MEMSKTKLVGMLSVLAATSVMVQSSCVQLNTTNTQLSSCPCEDAALKFTLEGETTVASHTVSERVCSSA